MVLITSLKTILSLKIVLKAAPISVPDFLLSHWSLFSVYIHDRLLEQLLESRVALGKIK